MSQPPLEKMTENSKEVVEAPKQATPQKKYQGSFMARLDQDEEEIHALERERAGIKDEPEPDKSVENTDHESGKPLPEANTAEEQTFKQRYGNLRRVEQKLRERIKELETQQNTETTALPSTPEELEEWMEKFPDSARVIKTLVAKESDARVATLEARIKEIESREVEADINLAEARILKAHPDFDELREDNEFHKWVATQPQRFQDMLYESMDPEDVIHVISTYKLHKGTQKKKTEAKKPDTSAASAVETKGRTQEPKDGPKGRVYKESEIARMQSREFAELEADINKARQEGRIVYDLSAAS